MALKGSNPQSPEDTKKVVDLLQQASTLGHDEATFQLGLCIADGFGVIRNTDRAVRIITAAANHTSIDAMMWLGFRCKNGTFGTAPQPKEALEWFKKAMCEAAKKKDAEREGKAREQVSLLMFLRILNDQNRGYSSTACGNERNHCAFIEVFQGALDLANKGYPNSKALAGFLLMNGLGTFANAREAVRYLSEAASEGVASAMNNYAICLLQGTGCSQSWRQAVEWFATASRLGNIPAKVNLAHCALIGQASVDVVKLLECGCQYDDPHAHLTTAICYYHGIGGFPRDTFRTEKHMRVAMHLGSFHAKEAMEYLEHFITQWHKKAWLELDSLKWEWSIPS